MTLYAKGCMLRTPSWSKNSKLRTLSLAPDGSVANRHTVTCRKVVFSPHYPYKPPSILMLTPSGRFAIQQKLCLSISDFHPESWYALTSVRPYLSSIYTFCPQARKGLVLHWGKTLCSHEDPCRRAFQRSRHVPRNKILNVQEPHVERGHNPDWLAVFHERDSSHHR